MTDPLVVVGGDAAGMSAASKCKRDSPETDVLVFEKGEWVSYGACGLPYYVKGEIRELDDLVSVTAEEFREERDVDLRTNHEVVAIDTEARTVTVDSPDGTFDQPYEDLLVSTGARAVEPPFEGMDLDGVFTLHSMESARDVRAYLHEDAEWLAAETGSGYGETVHEYAAMESPDAVAVVGGGYIGIEMAEAFAAHDHEVHVFEMLPTLLQPFGEAAADVVAEHLRDQGVHVHLNTAVESFEGDACVRSIRTDSGSFDVDMALVGVGVAPNAELAEAAGIDLGETGAISVDDYGRTSAAHVYAAGDCAEARNLVTGEPDHVPLALTANRAGRAIGQTLAGDPTPTGGIVGTAVVKAFDLEVARTGVIDEERAREAGFDPVSVTITDETRAHYYPGGTEIQITMVGDRESGTLLGASMVGEEGVSKRIDTVATALHADMTVSEVEYLDLAYAPPFSPVWDPVLTAAKVLAGKLEG
ncbi:FAD-dependent oxidoreductase [Haloarculaceae archaeon H-GB2-1]|nr:FAD-dependent oxidoreductase [Haloarculaceae archaeon H-GB1-1]MEA5406440.1 FAD-dependent oxidoreductase [Haloarculaceae archaeon H-GB2-1]